MDKLRVSVKTNKGTKTAVVTVGATTNPTLQRHIEASMQRCLDGKGSFHLSFTAESIPDSEEVIRTAGSKTKSRAQLKHLVSRSSVKAQAAQALGEILSALKRVNASVTVVQVSLQLVPVSEVPSQYAH